MVDIDPILALTPVVPVLTIDRVEHAVPVARALVEGGIRVLEVTLRTPAALDVIRAMKEVEGAIIGAGTVLNPKQYEQAVHAGCEFVVSPGLTHALGRAAADGPIPLLPGVATASDIMQALDLGFNRLKLFPVCAIGGLPTLKAFSTVFGSGLRFCPSGGITLENAPEWLAVDSVAWVGGTWLAPPGDLDTAAITERARHAAALRPAPSAK